MAPTRSGGEIPGKKSQTNVQTWSAAGAAMQRRASSLRPVAASGLRRLSRTEGGLGTGVAAHSATIDPYRPPDQAPQFPKPDPGPRNDMSGCGEEKPKVQEQPEGAAREDLVDLRRRRTPGATTRCQRGVFSSGFPHHVGEFIPSHHSTVIPTASGAASEAAAQPHIAFARGGRQYGISQFSTAGITSTGTVPCAEDALRRRL